MPKGRVRPITAADFESAYEELGKPVLSAKDVADHLGISVTTSTKYLKRLADRGEIHTTQVSNATTYFPKNTVIVQSRKEPLTYGCPIPGGSA